MSGHLPNGTHINPKFSGMHINPNFKTSDAKKSAQQIHVNPKFVQNQGMNTDATTSNSSVPKSNVVHINPKFANRALPPLPGQKSPIKKAKTHVNPSFLDGKKAKAYEEAIKMAVESKVHVKAKVSPTSAMEKENLRTPAPSTSNSSKTPSVFSSATKALFKRIGNRKLVRVKSNSNSAQTGSTSSQDTPKFRTSLTKIGTRKLVQANSKKLSPKNKAKLSLEGTYKVKTSRKIVKKQRSPIFATPFSAKKRKVQSSPNYKSPNKTRKYGLSKVFNPFRIDRRASAPAVKKRRSATSHSFMAATTAKKNIGSPMKAQKPMSNTNNQIQNYKVSPVMKKPAPPKPARRTPAKPKPSTTLINVQGVRYTVSDKGRKLNRVAEKTPEVTPNVLPNVQPKKLFLEGEEYIEQEPGVLIRSRNSMTRQSITSYKQRSINTILKSQTRSKQYCMFFNKFGKCKKKEDGVCPFIHDPEKIAVCRKFLQGNCFKDACLLSHKVAPEKMPVCKYYLEGLCSKDPCPYRHVKVSDSAEICPDFLKGFCPLYDNCMKRHENQPKPSTSKTGNETTTYKKVAPIKPKRKSIGATPNIVPHEVLKDKKKRYFEEDAKTPVVASTSVSAAAGIENNSSTYASLENSFEQKRQRLLKKVEMAKQGYKTAASVTMQEKEVPEDNDLDLDDSGPYEEIDEDVDETESDIVIDMINRPPVRRLPSFIPLTSGQSFQTDDKNVALPEEEEEEEYEERLI